MEFGNMEFGDLVFNDIELGDLGLDWSVKFDKYWDYFPQTLKNLENSLLAEVFDCQDVQKQPKHNYIEDEHDYFKKKEDNNHTIQEPKATKKCFDLIPEIKIEQDSHLPKIVYSDPRKVTNKHLSNITPSKRSISLLKAESVKENIKLSKSEQKTLKKFKRKMKNRVS